MKSLVLLLALACLTLSVASVHAQTESDTNFAACDSSNVYRIDDPLLAEKGFADSPIVESNPQFPGKGEALQKFFDEKLKLSEEAKSLFVRLHIKFTVSCKGKVGNFKILSPAAPELAQEILKVAEQMPDWEAGQVKGKAVDAHTKLAFTVSQGRAKVSYK
jgi:hypothetical protein